MPKLGSCASSARAWRHWAARHSQGEKPGHSDSLESDREFAASKIRPSTAFNHAGDSRFNLGERTRLRRAGAKAKAAGRFSVASTASVTSNASVASTATPFECAEADALSGTGSVELLLEA